MPIMNSTGKSTGRNTGVDHERDREFQDRQLPGAMAMQRRAWARGERGGMAEHVEVTGPDEVPVRIRVKWLGGRGVTADGRAGKGRGTGGNIVDPVGEFALVAMLVGLVMLFVATVRWLALELTGRPRWAVTAAVGAAPATAVVVLRTRRAAAAARAAAELADRVQQEGAGAVG
jgi:hypothetical protein